MSAPDPIYMRKALDLAETGLGRVAPNPSVGCVIVKDGRVVGEGRTQDGGRPHAEAVALTQAGEAAKGADIYVTLEPCFHDDRTSCSTSLIEAGVARVILGCRDQNPAITGKGIAALKQAGIAVVEGVMEEECAALNRGFFLTKTSGRPYVMLKMAVSLDSKIAGAGGHSQWITGEEARARVHIDRSHHDAILTGIGTILSDDPQLTTRVPGLSHSSWKIILDTTFRIPKNSKVLASSGPDEAIVFTSHDHADNTVPNGQVIGADLGPDGSVSIPFVLKTLSSMGVTRLMVEAGQGVFTSFLRSGLWDELHLYRAPILIGGDGKDAFGALGVRDIGGALRLTLLSEEKLGDDVLEIYAQSA